MQSAFLKFAKLLAAVAVSAILTACGGGEETALSPQKVAAAMPKASALPGSVTSAAAAELLLDAGEIAYPSLFVGPFKFRYYANTNMYLGVAVTDGQGYTLNGIYVVGAGFGTLASPSYQGVVTSYLNIVIDNNPGGGGTGHTLTVTVNVMGVISTITLDNVPAPTSEGTFCSELTSGTTWTQIAQGGGGTLTINSCSFNGTTGNISATMTITSPFTITVPYTITYTYS